MAPQTVFAQPEKARIGMLIWWPEDRALADLHREAFREVGWVEGRNLTLDFRWADGSAEKAAAHTRDLVKSGIDLLYVRATPAVQAAVDAARGSSIPIVTWSADPVGVGIVASLARPGGNLTGVSSNSIALSAKRLELLRAMVPRVSRVTYLASSADPQGRRFVEETRQAGSKLGIEVQSVFIRRVSEIDDALASIARAKPDAMIVQPLFGNDHVARPRIVEFMLRQRLPVISDLAAFAEHGGLATFGADTRALARQLAVLIDKVLKGAKPGDLPVQEPTDFELVINARAAKSIGLAIPPSVLLRANRVIE